MNSDSQINISSLENDNIIELKTVQSSPFRYLIEALKEILTDTNVDFDEIGMKIVAMDASHTVLVHLRLEGAKFDKYTCKSKQTIGISMTNLFKMIKQIGNNDTLTLYLESAEPNKLGIKIENGEKNSITRLKLNLMDLPDGAIEIPPASFESVITMPSTDFQKICRDFFNIGEFLDVKSVGNQLIFSVKGDSGEAEHVIGENQNGLSFVQNNNPNEIIQGVFALKHLVMFCKCTTLSNQIQIFLKNDYPLIIQYNVAALGEIKLCLAPQGGTN